MERQDRGRRRSRPRSSPRATARRSPTATSVLTHIWIGNGYTQKKASAPTTSRQPQMITVDDQALSAVFLEALEGQTIGSRVAVDRAPPRRRSAQRATPSSASATRTPSLVVVDLIEQAAAEAEGPRTQPAPSWVPEVEGEGRPVTGLDFAGTPKPDDELSRAVLIEGTARGQEGPDHHGQLPRPGLRRARSRSTRASRERRRRRSASAPAGRSRAGTRGWSGATVGSRVILAIPPEPATAERAARAPASRAPTRCTSWSTSSAPPEQDVGSAGDGSRVTAREERAPAQPADHAAGPARTTSPRTGSARSSTRTRADDAFEKMFERDKEDLRASASRSRSGSMDAYFDDEPGYRVRADEFALPEIELTADEAAVVGLATKVWEHARLAEATTEAVRKLTAAGRRVDGRALDIVEPRLGADEPSFDVFWEATQERTPVEFDYRRPGDDDARDAAPPAVGRRALLRALVRRRARHRPRRGAGLPALPGRSGEADATGGPARTTCPPGTDIREMARRLAPGRDRARRSCWCARAPGTALRRDAARRGRRGRPDDATGWDRVRARARPVALGRRAARLRRRRRTSRRRPTLRDGSWRGCARPWGRVVSAASDAARKDQVARLLDAGALPPHPRRRSARRGGRRPRRAARAAGQGPQGAVHVRAARAATPTT